MRIKLALAAVLGLLHSGPPAHGEVREWPRVVDERLEIELVAAEPDVVTPTGIAVDDQGRVLVIESHTHFRPANYAGPPADRIRLLADFDAGGQARRVTTFFEGTQATMNLAVYHDGSLFVATRGEVFRLWDDNGDGVADRRAPVARLETVADYPHNGLSGFAFDSLGRVYFGLGENRGEPYALVGTDGKQLTGGGEGGSIYRVNADGSDLERVATGFWNPYHVCFDAFGRLFAVDNDPDSRPPCRLLHIVEEGDYGYRYRNGRKGIHPFTAWNGELPGTLPMVAGTGEAPSGVVAYDSDQLPADYRGTLLVTSWGDHRVDRFRLEPRGASVGAAGDPIVVGGENFRPVGIALAPDGSIYISDWVDRSYELHGKGRVWRIRAKENKEAVPANPVDAESDILSTNGWRRERAARRLLAGDQGASVLWRAAQADDPAVRATALAALLTVEANRPRAAELAAEDRSPGIQALVASRAEMASAVRDAWLTGAEPSLRAAALRQTDDEAALVAALRDADPFIQQAARYRLGKIANTTRLVELTHDKNPAVRLGASLVLRERLSASSEADAAAETAVVDRLLSDVDPRVRFAAIRWAGEEQIESLRGRLEEQLRDPALRPELFEAVLAALERLDGVRREPADEFDGQQYILRLALADDTSSEVRAHALAMLSPQNPGVPIEKLAGWIDAADEALRAATIDLLASRGGREASELLSRIVTSSERRRDERLAAVAGLDAAIPAQRGLLLELATGEDAEFRRAALLSLRGCQPAPEEKTKLAAARQAHPVDEQWYELALGDAEIRALPPLADIDAWVAMLKAMPGDAASGRRVFFHPRGAACYRCHRVGSRGGTVGPELTAVRGQLDDRKLVESLLAPSKEIAPQFMNWNVETKDGRILAGVLLSHESADVLQLADAQGDIHAIERANVERMAPQQTSIMPERLTDTLAVQELRDLLAFLGAFDGQVVEAAGP